MNEIIVYFSLNPVRKLSFYRYIKAKRICYNPKFSFSLAGEDVSFNDPRDLITIIEHNPKKDSLHIIIDYVSCCGTGNESNYAEVIRDIIMCYPEVQILFDETFVKKSEDERKERYNYLNFLFWKVNVEDVASEVLVGFHQFELKFDDPAAIKSQFIRLLKGCNNMFDGSNLRYAIKKFKFGILDVESNYKKLQKSRCDHAAIVVEEEYHQNMFNCYCLYACGYRVIPIVSATELLWINKTIIEGKVKTNDEGKAQTTHEGIVYSLEPPLLLRDYDLQFVDENRVKSGVKKGKKSIITDADSNSSLKGKNVLLNEVDYIRGAKFFIPETDSSQTPKPEPQSKEKVCRIIETKKGGQQSYDNNAVFVTNTTIYTGDDASSPENPYWMAFQEDNIYFVSKGDPAIEIDSDFDKSMVTEDGKTLKLKGLKKPLEGIYASLKNIKCVDERYANSRESDPFKITRGDNSGHSLPLDLYGVTRSMVRRAEEYLKNGSNRLAAFVAGEALEVLNGFHKSLMNKAYYIQAVAENAMAVSLLGGDEDYLREDVKIRLKQKVKEDIKRMIPDEEDSYNLLYNIYNDCMLFCQKKEYYDAADEALSIMVTEKDGWHYEDCWKSIKKWYATKFGQKKKSTH
jgi:hypothetical protein